jgi:hypothetical protein
MNLSGKFKLAEWLAGLGLDRYAELFAAQNITGDMLAELTDADLKTLGIASLGHRKRLLQEIQKLTPGAPAQPETLRPPAATVPKKPAKTAAPPVAAQKTVPAARAKAAPVVAAVAEPPAAVATVQAPVTAVSAARAQKLHRGRLAAFIGGHFLIVSICVHLLFGVGATLYVVQIIQAKRKVTFQNGLPTLNPSARVLEHKVAMAQKKKAGGAPPQARRIASTGLAKVSLPDMPSIPSATTVVPGMMAGMGGAGFGTGLGFGSGMGSGMGGGGGGGGIGFFGLRMAARNIVLVIDISGSMIQGKKDRTAYDRLEKEAVTAMQGLDLNSRLNIIAFSGEPFVFSENSVTAGPGDKNRAIEWLKSYSPCHCLPSGTTKGNGKIWQSGKGKRHAGTSSEKALERAFQLKPDTILFVSDGEPTDAKPNEILKRVESWQRQQQKKVVINTIAYHADSGEDFMESLAKQNGGQFKNIR